MTRFRLIPVGAEQTVPPWKIESIVAVGLIRNDRVVNPVHVRSDNEFPYDTIHVQWKKEVAVIEHGGAIEEDFKNQDGQDRGADKGYRHYFDQQGKQYFKGMETHSRRQIKIQIRMVDPVQSPTKRYFVEERVLPIDQKRAAASKH